MSVWMIALVALVTVSLALNGLTLWFAWRRRGEGAERDGQLDERFKRVGEGQERLERATRDELERSRGHQDRASRSMREELGERLKESNDTLVKTLSGLSDSQHKQLGAFSEQLDRLIESNDKRLETLRGTLEKQLRFLQEDNNKKLDEMRQTVDEKLQGTLEKRLSESFKLVSEQLEQVHKGLGEMQNLAIGVGDLKRVLSNVKTRGIWGEILLSSLLEQLLAPEQFAREVAIKPGSRERVDFAVRLPGNTGAANDTVWLPIDAKFPKEDYERLVEASERGESEAVDAAVKQLETRVKSMAKSIHDKYIEPPLTTDFAILFLASEGLYAEVLRRPGLGELVQREYRVTIAGPTTLAALLNSLQMGFRTLAIQKRSSEVWTLLGAVKTEFGRFGDVLNSVQKKLTEASNHIEKASVRTRAIEKKLKGVEEMPSIEARALIGGDEEEPSRPKLLTSA
ncbi:MAG: DNA recombination protein RmuC [Myxococcota bacterium]